MQGFGAGKWLSAFGVLSVLALSLDFGAYAAEGASIVPARIRALEGSATIQRDQEQDRVEATINSPLYAGDKIDVESGYLEIQAPDGSLIWLDMGDQVQLLELRDLGGESGGENVLALQNGTLEGEISSEASSQAEMRIDTPEASVYLMSRGRFRVEATNATTSVVSYRGVVELAGDEGSVLVRTGQKSRVGSGDEPEEPWTVNTFRRDPFGEWCEERSASYVSENRQGEYIDQVPGSVRHYATELDAYGDWNYIAAYGWVWRPSVIQVGWRPYGSGYWSWCPRGWTWVSYEPWGWLPYHYGRWNWVTTVGWVWIPGAVYSGAWVSWAVTPTYIGWCPLDFYNRPAYVALNYSNVTVNQFGGGWNFLPLNRWGGMNLNRDIVRADRVPRLQGAVTTRSLPYFDGNRARLQPDLVQRVVRNNPVPGDSATRITPGAGSFRQVDRRELAGPRKVIRPPSRTEKVPGAPGDVPAPRTGRPNNVGKNGIPSQQGFRPVAPMRPRFQPSERRLPVEPERGSVGQRRTPPPRVPSVEDDPSRRVLNKILREGPPASAPDVPPASTLRRGPSYNRPGTTPPRPPQGKPQPKSNRPVNERSSEKPGKDKS